MQQASSTPFLQIQFFISIHTEVTITDVKTGLSPQPPAGWPKPAVDLNPTTGYPVAVLHHYSLVTMLLNGSALISINEIAQRRAWLVLGWVTIYGQVICLSI